LLVGVLLVVVVVVVVAVGLVLAVAVGLVLAVAVVLVLAVAVVVGRPWAQEARIGDPIYRWRGNEGDWSEC